MTFASCVQEDTSTGPSWYTAESDLYGTFSGTWTINGADFPATITISENLISVKSSMMSQDYTIVKYVPNDDQTVNVNGYDTEGATAPNVYIIFSDKDTGKFGVTKMSGFGTMDVKRTTETTTTE